MYKILLVDDEKPVLDVLTHLITWQEFGIDIIGKASSVDMALDLINRLKPDILITDIKMPNKTGLDLIRTLRSQDNPIKCIIISGYDDFNYIKEGLKYNIENYLLKPVDKTELLNTINQLVDKIDLERVSLPISIENTLKVNVLNRLIRDQISKEEFREKSVFVNPQMITSSLQVCIIKYDTALFTNDKIISILNLNLSTLTNPNFYELFCDFDGNVILILLSDFISQVKHLLDLLVKACNGTIRIAIGTAIPHYSKLYQSYNTAKKASNHFIVNNIDSIIFYDSMIEENNYITSTLHISIDYAEIENKIRNSEKLELQLYINNIFTQISTNSNVNFSYVKLMTLEIFILFNRVYKNISTSIPDARIIPDYLVDNINTAPSLDYLHTQLINLTESIDYFVDDTKYAYSPTINEIITYIHNNYSEDISLKIIAKEMAYSPSYLGKVFRKEVGVIFSEYVTKIKLEKAKFMIQNTNLKISDISKKVGISNTNYFYSIFKKYYHITPTEFRNS